MNTETLLQFFHKKLEQLPALKALNDYRDQEFVTWWNTVTSTYERMGSDYKDKAKHVRFTPGVVVGGRDNSAVYNSAYLKGLSNAEALLNSTIEGLETWGYNDETHPSKLPQKASGVTLNVTISQQQAQQITQDINLSQYDEAIRDKVEELLNELKKEKKDKPKIIDTVKWLTDKGADALIAILLTGLHLT